VKEGTEACDDGNNDNTDGCIIDSASGKMCVLATCSDGFVNGKVCAGGTPGQEQKCEIDTDCGTNGRCVVKEECDQGAGNGRVCTPRSGSSCTYCSAQCRRVTVSGDFCGDGKWDQASEECDKDLRPNITNPWAAGLSNYLCVGTPGVSAQSWDMTNVGGWKVVDVGSGKISMAQAWPSGIDRVGNTALLMKPSANNRVANTSSAMAVSVEYPNAVTNTNGTVYRVNIWAKCAVSTDTDCGQIGGYMIQGGASMPVGGCSTNTVSTGVTCNSVGRSAKLLAFDVVFPVSATSQSIPGTLRIFLDQGDTPKSVFIDNVTIEPASKPPTQNPWQLAVSGGVKKDNVTQCNAQTCQRGCPQGGWLCDNTIKYMWRCGVSGALRENTSFVCPNNDMQQVVVNDVDGDGMNDDCDPDNDNDGDLNVYDCASLDRTRYHDAPEICGDNIDSNCDGNNNDGCADVSVVVTDRGAPDDSFEFFVDGVSKGVFPQYNASGIIPGSESVSVPILQLGPHKFKIVFKDTKQNGTIPHDHAGSYKRDFGDNVRVVGARYFANDVAVGDYRTLWPVYKACKENAGFPNNDGCQNDSQCRTSDAPTIDYGPCVQPNDSMEGLLIGEASQYSGQGGYVEYDVVVTDPLYSSSASYTMTPLAPTFSTLRPITSSSGVVVSPNILVAASLGTTCAIKSYSEGNPWTNASSDCAQFTEGSTAYFLPCDATTSKCVKCTSATMCGLNAQATLQPGESITCETTGLCRDSIPSPS
jgi:hypothetical protein